MSAIRMLILKLLSTLIYVMKGIYLLLMLKYIIGGFILSLIIDMGNVSRILSYPGSAICPKAFALL